MSALLLKASNTFSPSVLALAKTNTKHSSLRSQRKQSSSDVVVSASAGVGQGTSLPFRFLLSREYDYDFCSVIHSRENQLISLQCNRNPDDNDLTSLSLSLSACDSNKRWIRNGHPQIRHLNRGGVLIRRRGHLVYQIWTRRAVRQTRCEIR